jgi:hypothetical protein
MIPAVRQELYKILDFLPDAVLIEIIQWLKQRRLIPEASKSQPSGNTPYQPVPLSGLWQGVVINEEQVTSSFRNS